MGLRSDFIVDLNYFPSFIYRFYLFKDVFPAAVTTFYKPPWDIEDGNRMDAVKS